MFLVKPLAQGEVNWAQFFVLYKLPFWIVNSCEVLVEIRWWWCPSTRWASGGRTRRATLSLSQLMRNSHTHYSAREGATNFQKELLCFWFYQTRAEWWGHRWIVQTWGHPGGKPMVVTGHHCDHNDCHHHNHWRHWFKEQLYNFYAQLSRLAVPGSQVTKSNLCWAMRFWIWKGEKY